MEIQPMTTPDEIRAEAIDRLARMQFQLDEPYEHWAPQYRREVTKFVDALGDMLPTHIEERGGGEIENFQGQITRRIPKQRRYITDWIEVTE
ncbi:hypothetical protein ACIP5Y_21155 [Nocardia sp. NPDC088792]|uniref:hypothetical protein n=1 Tax=Nocardia sp. NPDC088792 TaxID=3364332 RepID=UPI003812A274